MEASHLGGLLPVIHAVISEDPLLVWTVSVVTNITSAAIPPRGFTSLSMHLALGSSVKLRLLSLRLRTASEVLWSRSSKCPGLVVFQSSCAPIKSEVTTATGNWTKGIVMNIAEFHLFRRSVDDTLPFYSMRPITIGAIIAICSPVPTKALYCPWRQTANSPCFARRCLYVCR